MKEKSANSALTMALQSLPKYEPSAEIWATLEKELDLHKGIQSLPTHTPSKEVWETIEQHLNPKSYSVFWLKRLSIAAAILLLVGSYLIFSNSSERLEQFTYQQEEIDLNLLVPDWEEDAEVVSQIEKRCASQQYLCTALEFQSLQQELVELENAKMELKTAIDNYGKDIELIAQLSEIELERTHVLKKMVAQIL